MLGSSIQLTPAKTRRRYQLTSRTPNPPLISRTKPPVQPSRSAAAPSSNLDRFLESTTPSVNAHYLSKTRMRGWRSCDVELKPYFVLGDLWEAFEEWSVYGAGVPLVMDGGDGGVVVQYYVPYLSGMQLYGDSSMQCFGLRQLGEESDGDSRDSNSDGSSDYEHDGCFKAKNWIGHHLSSTSMLRMDRLSLRENHLLMQDVLSSDYSEVENARGCLLFEYLEQDSPYCREPLADKISDLACRFPELKTIRSFCLLPTSWMSIAWYPIYRIPTGPTLKDLDACFLTFHSLSTPMNGSSSVPEPVISFTQGAASVPEISLPAFGLASYKFRPSVWALNGGHERQSASSLLQAADSWLRLLHVHHPDYQFFVSHNASNR